MDDGQTTVTTIYINQYYEKTGAEVTTSYYLGGKLIVVKQVDELSYIQQDHLGSTSVVSDEDGDSTGTIKYFAFGLTRSITGTLPTDKKFTGQRLDDNTGLYYYNARYYDPEIGRFISADTIVPNPMNPQSLNRYSYCLNNPLKYIDPTGQRWTTYYFERGAKWDIHFFETDEEACDYFFKWVSSDPLTRIYNKPKNT